MRIDPNVRSLDCEGVYSPREDTLLLIRALDVAVGERTLEVGCGSGLVSLHLAKAGALVTAVDINKAAVGCTLRGAEENHIALQVVESDLFSAVRGKYDLIVFNPPYLASEEHLAKSIERSWAGGKTGTEVLRGFLDAAPSHLNPSGRIVVVVSSHMDRDALNLALQVFEWRLLLSERLFFEELRVLELRPEQSFSGP